MNLAYMSINDSHYNDIQHNGILCNGILLKTISMVLGINDIHPNGNQYNDTQHD